MGLLYLGSRKNFYSTVEVKFGQRIPEFQHHDTLVHLWKEAGEKEGSFLQNNLLWQKTQ